MIDIFISYTKEDVAKAELLAHALTERGWSVWWDRNISPGQIFEDVIEKAIETSKCVVVLLSTSSVKSDWVRSEAQEGADRKILVPVLIDDCRIPFTLRRIHAADFRDWVGDSDASQIVALSESISRLVEGSAAGVTENVVSIESRSLRIESSDTIPGDVDAVVVEQDTALVLDVNDEIKDSGESMESLTRKIADGGHAEQGSVVVLATVPRRILAIVHNFDNDPSWTEAAVIETVQRVLELSAERRFKSIAMPLLGTVHGDMPVARAREILDEAIAAMPGRTLRKICLLEPRPIGG